MKIDNQIIKEESNKDMLEELKCQSDRMWEILQEVNDVMLLRLEVGAFVIEINKIIKKYKKKEQADE